MRDDEQTVDQEATTQWELPGFRDLLASAGPRLGGPDALPIVQCGTGSRLARTVPMPQALCSRFSLEPLLLDVSIIQPRFHADAAQGPLAVSHVVCDFDDELGRVAESYNEALLFLAEGSEDAGSDPIVAHPDLYGRSYVQATVPAGEHAGVDAPAGAVGRSYSSFSWRYKPGQADNRIQDQVDLLAARFRSNLSLFGVSSQQRSVYEHAHILVVPFVRPEVEPILSGPRSARHGPEPSGGVFLIVRSEERAPDYATFAGLLQRELLYAALSDSYGEATLQRQRLGLYEGLGHALKAMVQVTAWWIHREKLAELVPKSRAKHRLALEQATNGFNLFAPVQGMGELIRLVALLQRGQKPDFEKISQWVARSEFEAWQNGDEKVIVAPFVETIKKISVSICRAYGWPRVTITSLVAGEKRAFCWDHPEDSKAATLENAAERIDFDPRTLRIPPLRADTGAIFAFLPSVVEPMRNALEYLLKTKHEFGKPHALRVHVESVLPDHLTLCIGNAVPSNRLPPPKMPDGLRVTQRLVEEIGLTEFGGPELRATAEGYHIYWIKVLVRPYQLCCRILSGLKA